MTIIRVWPAEGGARVFVYISYTENTRSSVLICQRVHSLSHDGLFATPWNVAHQASLSVNSFCNLLKLMSIKSVMPFNHLILCRPLLLLPSIFPSIGVFSNESVLHIRWPKIGVSSSVSVLPMNNSGLISFQIDWFDLLDVLGTLRSLLQHHSSKTLILQCSAFSIVQISHPYTTPAKIIALTRWTFAGKVILTCFLICCLG